MKTNSKNMWFVLSLFALVLMFSSQFVAFASTETVKVSNCDSGACAAVNNIDYNNYIEGKGCLKSLVSFSPNIDMNFDAVDASSIGEGSSYLNFYVYIDNMIGLKDYGDLRLSANDDFYQFQFNPTTLAQGWNFLSLPFAVARRIGNPSMNKLTGLTIGIYKDNTVSCADTYIKIDDVNIASRQIVIDSKDIKVITNDDDTLKDTSIANYKKPFVFVGSIYFYITIIGCVLLVCAGVILAVILVKKKHKNQ